VTGELPATGTNVTETVFWLGCGLIVLGVFVHFFNRYQNQRGR
jgi:LPXTG-motif cell wall-anchored protein